MSKIIAVIGDLIFRSKVEGTGSALGAAVRTVSSAREVSACASGETPSLVIVDMALPQADAEAAIRAAKEAGAAKIVAFFSHVDTQLAESAKRSGADEVMPRSRFVTALPDLIRETL
ncbi:MAG: CoA-binding protein [Phycisphaerales bacterium]|nr:CoA-binding protein [Phycisphaerales bacterium]